MNKKLIFFYLIAITSISSINAQTGWGIKGSLIFNSNGELTDEVGDIIDNNGDGEAGFNVGFYARLNVGRLYIRPELIYSQSSSKYTIDPEIGSTESFTMKSIDVPVLVGLKIIGPLHVFAGPSFKFILDSEFENLNYESIANDVTVGYNVGLGLKLGRLEVDLRYDSGFSDNQATFIDNIVDTSSFTLDTRQQQIIIGVSYRLSSK